MANASKKGQAQTPPHKRRDKRLKWTPTPYVEAGLIRIEKLGILGAERSEIVNHIIGEELRRLIETGLLRMDELREALAELPDRPNED